MAYFNRSELNEFYQLACKSRSKKIARWIISNAEPFSTLENALHLAVKMGDEECVREIIKKNPEMNLKDGEGKTPLHYAVNSIHLTKILMDNKADPYALDDSGQTPLHLAVLEGYIHSVKLLFDYGVNPSIENSDGKTALHLAVQKCNGEVVKLILQNSAEYTDLVNKKDKNGNTALIVASQIDYQRTNCIHSFSSVSSLDWAVIHKELESLEILLNHGKDRNDSPIDRHRAGESKAYYFLRQIWKRAAEVTEHIIQKHMSGDKTLFEACKKDQQRDRCLQILLENGADPYICDKTGRTALHWAVDNKKLKCVEILLKCGINPNKAYAEDQKDKSFGNCITELCEVCKEKEETDCPLKKMFIDQRVNLNERDNLEQTALHFAVKQGNLACVRILLKYQIDPLLKNKYGQTALHLAVENNNPSLVKVLLQHTRKRFRDFINLKDNNGNTALHQTCIGTDEAIEAGVRSPGVHHQRKLNCMLAAACNIPTSAHLDP
ncbi:putative ankyrin repeat protein RF_0381 [Uranotaenia lowii]|uniref:putative ankyrin repeat protein RF_0381 n=1 Tax=Uranotaenia lowii TaxID=190385 RepID=UPI00247942D8|nr:putative ankyrin repeat protein RF_0381 [Uranotaenia lowii]